MPNTELIAGAGIYGLYPRGGAGRGGTGRGGR